MLFFSSIIQIEFICFLFSIFYLADKRVGWYKHLVWMLLLTIAVESLAYYTVFIQQKHSNHAIWNLFLPVYVGMNGWIMYQVLRPLTKVKLLMVVMSGIFSVLYLYESISGHFKKYSANANTAFSIGMVILCLVYYYHLLKSDEDIDVYRHADFWLISGLFIFHFVATASNFFFKYTASFNQTSIKPIRFTIMIILNFILYSFWTYSFICRYRKAISSSSLSK